MLGISGSLREPWPGQSKCSRCRMSPRCRRHWLVWRCRCAFIRRVRISLRCCNRLHGVCSFQLGDNDVVFGRNRACRRDDGETGTGDDSAKCCNVHGRGYWLVMANLSYIFECAKVFCAFFCGGPRLSYLISKYRRRGGSIVKENYVGGKIACPVGAQYIAPV